MVATGPVVRVSTLGSTVLKGQGGPQVKYETLSRKWEDNVTRRGFSRTLHSESRRLLNRRGYLIYTLRK